MPSIGDLLGIFLNDSWGYIGTEMKNLFKLYYVYM